MEREIKLEIEELEERIAPGRFLLEAPPGIANGSGGGREMCLPAADAADDGLAKAAEKSPVIDD